MKYALITGASSGIGREFALVLAKEGYNLILVARREDRLIELKEEILKNYNVKILLKVYDLSRADNCYHLHKECKWFPIRLVINNAGFGKAGQFLDIDIVDEVKMIKTNVISLHILTKLFANSMIKGRILNIASMAGFMPDPLMATYGATKSYVIQMSRAVNYELKRSGKNVKICVLCPGPIATEFQDVANVKKKDNLNFVGKVYERQMATAKDCAKIGWLGVKKGEEVIYLKKSDRFLSKITKILPTSLLLPIQYEIQRKKI
ncbi:SDR family NAD(P)-dependent oxidoreductase [Anaeromicropila herbilytica]|uniref:Short-chain dehydrogenase n=1 Tax=Anaeromicropila herbilytica TaxID=2785025 RepID=A0A7R7EKX1_9FIRM|nr:SDR family oxidoreductase [Anaeromicropila herbilytica]BCN30347.1 short-chain dehydrogenase [Anaeromicropila herbilytica]